MPLEVRGEEGSGYCLYHIGTNDILQSEIGNTCFRSELQAQQVAAAFNSEVAYRASLESDAEKSITLTDLVIEKGFLDTPINTTSHFSLENLNGN